MYRALYFRVGGRYASIPRLIGAFILLASILMLFSAMLDVFEAVDRVKDLEQCVENLKTIRIGEPSFPEGTPDYVIEDYLLKKRLLEVEMMRYCEEKARAAGISFSALRGELTDYERWNILVKPVAGFLFWAAILIFAIMLYRTGKITLPIEEELRIVPEKSRKTRKKKKA